MLNEPLDAGRYQLEEIRSPEGYLINKEPIKFEIGTNVAYQTLPDGTTPVITVEQEDISVKGRITVEKRGEVLSKVLKNKDGNMEFIYEEKPLPNAKFEIFALENIMSADNQKDIIYKKGEVVETLVTGQSGQALSKELPLGKYGVRETLAP